MAAGGRGVAADAVALRAIGTGATAAAAAAAAAVPAEGEKTIPVAAAGSILL